MPDRVLPKYPVYVPSKGRAATCLTAQFLVKDEVPFRLVVEAPEFDAYAARFGPERLLVLPFQNQGLVAARCWIKDHSISEGHARHWQLDDNISRIRRWAPGNERIPVRSGVAFRVTEDFVDRYENVAIAGLNYNMFGYATGKKGKPPFHVNVHVYSCLAAGTRVLCDDLQWRPVGDLRTGDGLVGFDEFPVRVGRGQVGAYRYLRPARVASTDVIVRPSYRVTFTDGRQVIASDDHRWLGRLIGRRGGERESARTIWLHTADLRVGDEVRDFGPPWEVDHSREAGWLAGIFDGEGFLLDATKRRAVCGFAQKTGVVWEQATTLLHARGFKGTHQLGANGVHNWTLTNLHESARLLGSLRPVRLLQRTPAWLDGYAITQFPGAVVADVEEIGDHEVVALGTSTGTFIAEGFLSHNCTLVNNAIPHYWRRVYNDDTDICLQVLADGWCTVLMNVFLAEKRRTMTVKGGNTPIYQQDGRLRMARSLAKDWPYVVSVGRRFSRPQHVVKDQWRRFDTPLRRKPGLVLPEGTDEYGLRLTAQKE